MILEKNTEFKESKLGLIPVDWSVLSIGSVFDFLKTNSLSRSQLINEKLDKESIFNIHYGDIHSSFNFELLDLSKQEKLPKIIDNQVLKSNPDFLKDGDLIIADASEDYLGLCDCVELINIGELKIVSGLHTFALRDKSNNFANGFKSYVFKNQKVIKSIARIATGISVLGVTKSNLSKLLIPVPPLKEQQKIAEILSQWDEAIETIQNLIEKLKLRKKGLMQELLSGKKRLPGFTDEWSEEPLGKFIRYTPRPKEKPKNHYLALGLRSHGKGIFHKENFDPNSIAMDTLYEVKENDLVVNITFAWEHAIAVANSKDEGGLVSHRFPTYTFVENQSDPIFFRYYVLQKRFKYLLNVISPGGAGRNRVMSKKDFPKLIVKVPPFNEQVAISKVLSSVDNEIEILLGRLKTQKIQKIGLMQQLLTGQKRVI
jgi:type I restriction enzyme S subunit